MDRLQSAISEIMALERWCNRNPAMLENPPGWLAEEGRKDRRNLQLVLPPDQALERRQGSCYDQSFLIKRWL